MKITEEDLKKLFESDNSTPKPVRQNEPVVLKKVKSTDEIKKIRKTLRRIGNNKPSANLSEVFNSILRFLAVSGFAGFVIFLAMSWGGISKQLEWGYFVSYLNEAVPTVTPTARPNPAPQRTPDDLNIPSNLPSLGPGQALADFPANQIKIERIGLSSPVLWDVDEENIIDKLKDGVVHYKGTSRPGEGGNIFIVGHSSNYFWIQSEFNTVFALLDKLTPGDRVEISTDNRKYIYEVKITNIVKPNDVQVLENTPKETLSLMTCWPIGTTLKRMIVQAELL